MVTFERLKRNGGSSRVPRRALDFHFTSVPLLTRRQRENVQRVAVRRRVYVGQDRSRHVSRAAAAEACGDGNVLFAADAECYWKTLHGRSKTNLPQDFSCVHIDGAEVAVKVADERDSSVRRKHGGQKRGPLLPAPDFFHGFDVEGGEFSHVAVGAGHFVKLPVARRAARSFCELDFPSG